MKIRNAPGKVSSTPGSFAYANKNTIVAKLSRKSQYTLDGPVTPRSRGGRLALAVRWESTQCSLKQWVKSQLGTKQYPTREEIRPVLNVLTDADVFRASPSCFCCPSLGPLSPIHRWPCHSALAPTTTTVHAGGQTRVS